MEPATFIEKILKQILTVIPVTKQDAAWAIEYEKVQVNEDKFKKWLIEERYKELNSPDLKNFDLVQRETMGTPEEAANELAQFVEFHLGTHLIDGKLISTADKIDWGDVLSDARAILSGFADLPGVYEFKVQDPQLWLPFRTYYKAIKSEAMIQAYEDALNSLP